MIAVPTKNKLADVLEQLELRAHQDEAPAYHELQRGLCIRIHELESGWQIAIAREWPMVPSEVEENTILQHLAPLYHGQWHRTYKQIGRRGLIWNVSRMDYHR